MGTFAVVYRKLSEFKLQNRNITDVDVTPETSKNSPQVFSHFLYVLLSLEKIKRVNCLFMLIWPRVFLIFCWIFRLPKLNFIVHILSYSQYSSYEHLKSIINWCCECAKWHHLKIPRFGYPEGFTASSWNDFLVRLTGNKGKWFSAI